MVETGGYKKCRKGSWVTGKGFVKVHWKEHEEFIDNYKQPVQIREITNRMGFIVSEILTDTDNCSWSRWSDCLYWVRVDKLVAIQGITISAEFINIPDNDIWYLCEGNGRCGGLKFAVNPEVTTWIPVHASFFRAKEEKLRQTRSKKGDLTNNDQKLITEAIKQYNSKKLT
jgi:hypothetical protein